MICGHGSRNRIAVDEFSQLVDAIRLRIPKIPVQYGYLEFARPIIREGLDKLREKSVKRVLAIPAMLFAATHAKNDIPSVLNTYSSDTGLRIDYGRELGVDRLMIEAAGERIKEAIALAPEIPFAETMLVVVGRGSSDPDANSNVAKVTRMLIEAFGFGWGETFYSGVTFPLVEPGLRKAVKLGFKRIIVLPYFLFSGVLVSRIRQQTANVANENSNVEFLSAGYLGSHHSVVDTFIERIEEAYSGEAVMNCALCKYRDKLLGFESEVGLPQESHHHHVEGLAETCNLCEEECTGACEEISDAVLENSHHHRHSHSKYPHKEHPLGPSSFKTPPNSGESKEV
ncbi:sirohydrochlorin chelatase [Prochlorococcus sp. MIT 1341]|uniref:sirohydrochlorin chelatase n=1 Tax=Prochlorococcus sp. MIT 1341 TaxID=3096221 RepID=UPI002A74B68A|nr:sirohydrochlorin chelatase [Prochlorococcus sp. MIT 1341]